MEGMPVSHSPGPTQQQAPDSDQKETAALPRSAFLRKRGRNKKVHWDDTIVDNELPKAKSPRPSPPRLASSIVVVPTSAPNQSTPTVERVAANSSMKIDSPSTLPAQSIVPNGHGPSPKVHPQQQSQDLQWTGVAIAPTRLAAQTSTSHRQNQPPAANSGSKIRPSSTSHGTSRFDVEVRAAKLSPRTHRHHSKTHRSAVAATSIPPQVPDPPHRRVEGPPPTPRITRLPSPDLPEVGGYRFCACDDARDTVGQGHAKMCEFHDRDVAKCKKPVYVKMDAQLEAAKAYMKNARK